MNLKQNVLLYSASYIALIMLNASAVPAFAAVTVNGSGEEVVIDSAAVTAESSKDYGGITVGSYILGVAQDGKTVGNIRLTESASVTLQAYTNGSLVKDGTLNMTGGSIINEGTGILAIKDGILNLSNGAKILSQGAPSGSAESEAENKGTLQISGGTFTMSGTAEIGGSYGTGNDYKSNGGIVTVSGGDFTLSGESAFVQKGKGDLTFAPGAGDTLVFNSTSSKGIVHSGSSGDILIKGGTFTFDGAGGISKGQSETDNATEGNITVSGGKMILKNGSTILMTTSNTGDITFSGLADLTATGEPEGVFNAVVHQGKGSIKFGDGTKTTLANARVYALDEAKLGITGGTFVLTGESAIGVINGTDKTYKQETGEISIANGSFTLSDKSVLVQEGAASIVFAAGSTLLGQNSFKATATDKSTGSAPVVTGIVHSGASGDIDIAAANMTFTGKGAGIYKGRSTASETTAGDIKVSGENTTINILDGASVVMDVSSSGNFDMSDGILKLQGQIDKISSVINNGTGAIKISDKAEVNLASFAQMSSKGNFDISKGTINVKLGSLLSAAGNFNISGGSFTLSDAALLMQNGSGSLVVSKSEESGAVAPDFTVTSSVGATDTILMNTGFMHAGTAGNMAFSEGTYTFTGSGTGVYKGGLSDVASFASKASAGDINISGGTWTFANDAKITMGGLNTGSINISGGTLTFTGTKAGIYAQNGQDINFSGGTIEAGDVLNISGNLIISDAAVLANSGTLNFKDKGGIVFNKEMTWAGDIVVAGGKTVVNKDATVSKTFKSGGTVDVVSNTLTVNDAMTFNNGATFALTMADKDKYGKIKADSVTVGNGTTDTVKMNINIVRGSAIKDVSRRFTFIETANALNSDQFSISNKRYSFIAGTDCPNDLCYDVTMILGASDVVKITGGTVNQEETARAYLDGAMFEQGTAIYGLAEQLEHLSQQDWDEYKKALSAVAPDPEDAGINTVASAQNKIIGAIGNRMGEVVSLMNSGVYGRSGGSDYSYPSSSYYRNSPDYGYPATSYNRRPESRPTTPYRPWEKSSKRYGVWAQGLYNKTKLSASGNGNSGFDGNTSGVALGIDAEVAKGVLLGIGYAYTTSDIDGYMRTTKIEGNSGFLYGFYKPSRFFVSGILSAGQSTIEEEKTAIETFIKDEYKSTFFAAQVMTGYEMGIFTPSAGVRYAMVTSEKHTDSLGQEIKSQDNKTFTGILEGKLSQQYYLSKYVRVRPEVSLAATYDFVRDGNGSTVFLPNGTNYVITGRELDKFGVEAGAGATILVDNSIELSLSYKGEFKKDYTNNSVMFKARYNF